MVSWCSFPVLTNGLLVLLPNEPMITLMRCLWESLGVLLLYHPSPLVLMVLLSREHQVFSSDMS